MLAGRGPPGGELMPDMELGSVDAGLMRRFSPNPPGGQSVAAWPATFGVFAVRMPIHPIYKK
jgi:hypothetical protein